MARIIAGISTSHTPTIGFAKDTNKQDDPVWKTVFEAFEPVSQWLNKNKPDVLFYTYNDHITSFFFDHYSPFVLGVDDQYVTADEGGGAREYPPVKGHAPLARHIGNSLYADEFDISFFQKKPVDHGLFSPLSMFTDKGDAWDGSLVLLQVGVLQFPVPSPMRCYRLGKAIRKAIESYHEDITVALVATGGLSHQVHGERCGFTNTEWDMEFISLLENDPQQLAKLTIAEYAERGGMEGAEVLSYLIMRGALSDKVKKVHQAYTVPSMTAIGTLVFENLADEPDPTEQEAQRQHINHQLNGIEKLEGTYPFTLDVSHKRYRINDFLHRLVEPAHRERFLNDTVALYKEFKLTNDEITMLDARDWQSLIRYGVNFFLLEKMAAVIGLGNIEVYAGMRGLSVEEFQKTRNVRMKYSVAGGHNARQYANKTDS
jgi:gallate dioxygenase